MNRSNMPALLTIHLRLVQGLSVPETWVLGAVGTQNSIDELL